MDSIRGLILLQGAQIGAGDGLSPLVPLTLTTGRRVFLILGSKGQG